MPGLLRFRLLQMLDRAVDGAELQNVGEHFGGEPLKRAWVLRHSDLFAFDEPRGRWYVEPRHYWELYEANKNAAWAEELAWVASSLQAHGDECYSDCVLQWLVDRPLQYWKRYPAGPHTADSLKAAANLASDADKMACDKTSPDIAKQTSVPRERLAEIRSSLLRVTNAGKGPILKSLDDIERKCRQ